MKAINRHAFINVIGGGVTAKTTHTSSLATGLSSNVRNVPNYAYIFNHLFNWTAEKTEGDIIRTIKRKL